MSQALFVNAHARQLHSERRKTRHLINQHATYNFLDLKNRISIGSLCVIWPSGCDNRRAASIARGMFPMQELACFK